MSFLLCCKLNKQSFKLQQGFVLSPRFFQLALLV
jgi:hypothetical protein